MLVEILLDYSQLHLIQSKYWNRNRNDVWYWFIRYDSAGRCIMFSVGVCNTSRLSVPQLLLEPAVKFSARERLGRFRSVTQPSSDIRILCAAHEEGGWYVNEMGQRNFECAQELHVFPARALVCSVPCPCIGL